MLFTVALSAMIAFAIHCARVVVRRLGIESIREMWDEARWYEKVLLALALAPVPGPFDEIAGILILRRIGRRLYLANRRTP